MLVSILVFANWGKPDSSECLWYAVYSSKWRITGLFGFGLFLILIGWFHLPRRRLLLIAAGTAATATFFGAEPLIPFSFAVVGLSWITSTGQDQGGTWFASTWDYAKQILPLLLLGVLIAGALLGRPGHEGLIPSA